MKSALVVALGGAMGAVFRYWIAAWSLSHAGDWRFPIGTFAVNLIGCLVVGCLAGLVVKHDFFSPEMRLFLITGIAGGFTTFSAFGLETFHLLRRDEVLMAVSYVVSSVLGGLFLVGLGYFLVTARG